MPPPFQTSDASNSSKYQSQRNVQGTTVSEIRFDGDHSPVPGRYKQSWGGFW